MRETPTHKPDIPADRPGVRLYGIYTLSTLIPLTGTDRLCMRQCFIILKLLSEVLHYGTEMLFPLTQHTADSIMDVTLHHLQRKISSDVICCIMFSI